MSIAVTAEAVAESLSRIRRRPFAVRIEGIGALGTRKHHAIVARVQPTPALIELQAEHERILQRLGLPPDGRKFTPHITLARLRSGNARDIAEYLTLRGGFFAKPVSGRPVRAFLLARFGRRRALHRRGSLRPRRSRTLAPLSRRRGALTMAEKLAQQRAPPRSRACPDGAKGPGRDAIEREFTFADFSRRLLVHDARGAGGGEDGPPSRMVERLQAR